MSTGPAPSFSRAGRLWTWLLLGALTTFTTTCGGSSSLLGIGPSALVITDLNPKTQPILIEPDANDKDVSYKAKSVYKPKTVSIGGAKKDVRLLMRAKKDGAALRAVMDQELRANDLDLRIRVAFDPNKTTGLIDGTSLALFDFVLLDGTPAEGGSSLRRLEAVYNAGIEGYTVRATDGTNALGIELDVMDEEVVLRLRLAGGTLFMEAGRANSQFITDINTTELYNEGLGAEGSVAHTFAWGVSGLGKAARLYFTQLAIEGSIPDIGVAETPIAVQLASAVTIAANSVFPNDVGEATENMEDIRAQLVTAIADLTAAVDGGQLRAITQGERALKNAAKMLKLAEKAKALGEKMLAAGKTNATPLGKKARVIRGRLILALAQMGGYRGNSPSKVNKSGYLL